MNHNIQETILEKTKAKEILDVQLIQELWSGYGELNRIILDNGSCILKHIKLPTESNHPRGWNSDIGQQRKKKSYQIETLWYQEFNTQISAARLPQHIASGEVDDSQYLILEDLRTDDFTAKYSPEFKDIKACLHWLATFHRHYMNKRPHGLWPIGTYWHLETRPDELEVMTDLELKEAAAPIDSKLNSAKFQGLVHGDAKLANFLFNNKEAAAVDFQYVGGGIGVKDVAYFLSSIFKEEELEKLESECLDYYFSVLDHREAEIEWRELYPYAWCDFYRFLQGWSPGHWKINSYSEKMKERVLQCL